jgi:hypothetical protein
MTFVGGFSRPRFVDEEAKKIFMEHRIALEAKLETKGE